MKKAFLLFALMGIAAYAPSFQGAFLLDDHSSILNNPRIRSLWPVSNVTAESTRPLVQWSFAVNYRLGGLRPSGYHAVNLAVHLAAAFLLLALVSRLLKSRGLALAAAAIWMLHPLQTESVTYIVQRSESLMGLFYLASLCCFARGWRPAAVVCCALGMWSKPAMVTAPLAILWYDRCFLSGSLRQALRRSPRFYAALASTWALLALLLLAPNESSRSAGLWGRETLSPLAYAANQPRVLFQYLKLAVWPDPLCFDYLWPAQPARRLILPAAGLALLCAAVFRWGGRSSAAKFFRGFLFLTLVPASSFIPVRDLMVEHRMYLPLAALAVGAAAAGSRWVPDRRARIAAACVLIAALGGLTFRRNLDYRSPERMWRHVLAQRPENPRAHLHLAVALEDRKQIDGAIGHYRKALRLRPDYAEAHNNLGLLLAREKGETEQAWAHYRRAMEIRPDSADAYLNAGNLLLGRRNSAGALPYFKSALRLAPDSAAVHNGVGAAWLELGRVPEARRHFEEAVRLMPDYAEAHNNLGVVYGRLGMLREAEAEYRRSLRLRPGDPASKENLETILQALGR